MMPVEEVRELFWMYFAYCMLSGMFIGWGLTWLWFTRDQAETDKRTAHRTRTTRTRGGQ